MNRNSRSRIFIAFRNVCVRWWTAGVWRTLQATRKRDLPYFDGDLKIGNSNTREIKKSRATHATQMAKGVTIHVRKFYFLTFST